MKKASVRDSYKALSDLLKGGDTKRTPRRTVLLKGGDMKRTSREIALLKEEISATIKASERSRYWNDPAVRLAKCAAERTRYRRGHRTTTTTQRYVMACCINIKKLCMHHLYSIFGRPYYRVSSGLSPYYL